MDVLLHENHLLDFFHGMFTQTTKITQPKEALFLLPTYLKNVGKKWDDDNISCVVLKNHKPKHVMAILIANIVTHTSVNVIMIFFLIFK